MRIKRNHVAVRVKMSKCKRDQLDVRIKRTVVVRTKWIKMSEYKAPDGCQGKRGNMVVMVKGAT